jgi:hypothetical protein
MTVRLVLVKGKESWHAVPATYALTGVANLPSRFDLLHKWTVMDEPYDIGTLCPSAWGNDWKPGSLSSAMHHGLHVLPRVFHHLQIGAHTNQTLLGLLVECSAAQLLVIVKSTITLVCQ